METKFKVLTGTADQVEKELNDLKKDYSPIIQGMSATNESTTIVVELYPK